MTAFGYRYPPTPLVCRCDRPLRRLVYLWDRVRVDGAYECARCGRRIIL